jgi:hypothetical protein
MPISRIVCISYSVTIGLSTANLEILTDRCKSSVVPFSELPALLMNDPFRDYKISPRCKN